MNKFKKFLTLLGRITTITTLLFIAITIKQMDIDFSNVYSNILIITCIISTLVFACLVYIMAYGWKIILDFFSCSKNQFYEIARIYAKSNIGKYLPGNVMHYVERNLYAKKLNIKQKNILLSSIIEIGSVAFVAFVIALLFARKDVKRIISEYITEDQRFFFYFLILACLLIGSIIFLKLKKQLCGLLTQLKNKQFLIELMKLFFIYSLFLCGGGVIYGIIFFNITNVPYDISLYGIIIASYVLSWVIGFIVPGAPGGIGVREFILVIALGNLLGKEVVLTAALIHRLLTVLGDVVAWLISFFSYSNNDTKKNTI